MSRDIKPLCCELPHPLPDEKVAGAVCYSCVIVEIGQEIRQPHTHGG